MNNMKLRVVLFNQHWFHLCSAAEAIVSESHRFDEVELIFSRRGLKLWPLDLHFIDYVPFLKKYSPEQKLFVFLKSYLLNKDIEVKFTYLDVKSIDEFNQGIDLSLYNSTLNHLRKLRLGSQPVGMAISSYLISKTRSSNPKVKRYSNLVRKGCYTFVQIQAALSTKKFDFQTDEIWVCNGRQLHERSVVEFCKTNNIAYKFFEIGGDGFQLARWILHSHSPHDRMEFQNEIKEHFLKKRDEDATEVKKWFLANRSPKSNQFTNNQVSGKGLDLSEPFIVFYTSSDDEVAAISEDWDSPWGSQIDAVRALISVFKNRPRQKLIIRVHPNLMTKSKSDQKLWRTLELNPNTVLVHPSSNVDSYELLDNAKGVITFGSTIGVEAVYWGTPLGLMAHARYDIIVENSFLTNENDLSAWVNDAFSEKLIKPKNTGALMWAHYFLTGGNPWELTEIKIINGRKIGLLGGVSIRPNSVLIATARFFGFLRSTIVEQRLEFLYWRLR